MNLYITEEQKQKAVRLYRRKDLTIQEIANLTDMSTREVTLACREAFKQGILTPRRPDFALKPRVPNGQGTSKYIPNGIGKGGRNKERKKFTLEQEEEIAKDYYENGYTIYMLKEKYAIHPMQLQYIRNRFSSQYSIKKKRISTPVLQFDKQGNLIAEYENGRKASLATSTTYTNLNNCLNGRLKSAGGFVWKFKEE